MRRKMIDAGYRSMKLKSRRLKALSDFLIKRSKVHCKDRYCSRGTLSSSLLSMVKMRVICLSRRRKLVSLIFVASLSVLGICYMFQPFKISKFEPDSKYGSVFSLLVWEQMGNAAANLMNLQCWAGSLGMSVVEPSIWDLYADEVFHFSSGFASERFRNLFDVEHWNSYGREKGYSSLISLVEFVEKASRNVIYVELTYSGYLKCPRGTFDTISNSLSSPLQSLRRVGLSILYPYLFLSSHGFKIVRKVCIDLLTKEGRLRTQQEFNRLVFGDLLGHGNFTVVFDEWRGIRNESEREGKLDFVDINSEWHRILIKDSQCWYNCLTLQPYYVTWDKIEGSQFQHMHGREHKLNTAVLKSSKLGLIPSKKVLTDVDMFRDKHFKNKPYLAVKVRMEKYEITDKNLHTDCIKKIASYKKYALAMYKLTQTFFSSDVGKYGSNSHSWPHGDRSLSVQLYQDIINTLGTPSDRAETVSREFETLTHSTGRVSIAWTQAITVAEARCIIFLGGGAFQALVLNLHSALYRGNECFVYLDEHCSERAKLGFL